MKITVISENPAIIDVEFEELENIDFSQSFNLVQKRIDYGALQVESQRFNVEKEDWFVDVQNRILRPLLVEVQNKLLDIEYLRWPISENDAWRRNNLASKINCYKVIDNPGFFMPWHLDNRWNMMAGIINIQDNEVSTHFSKKESLWQEKGKILSQEDIIHVAMSKKNTGTFWANTEITWHSVPYCENIRKLILADCYIT